MVGKLLSGVRQGEPTDDEIARRGEPVDIVRPELQHFLALLCILGPVVNAPHATDGVIKRLLHDVGRPAILVQ